MKLRHGELEVCRANPAAWVTSKLSPGGSPRMSYEYVAVMAIYHLHKTGDLADTLAYLPKLASKHKLTNSSRLDLYEEKVSSYAAWLDEAKPIVIARKINIRLSFSETTYLAGEMSRLDIDLISGGYRAVLLSDKKVDIHSELRMPLLQQAVAARYGRDVEDVAVGVQSIDASNMEVRSFSSAEVSKALAEAAAIAAAIDRLGHR